MPTSTDHSVTGTHHAPVLHHALPAVVVHVALRREFRLASRLVRDVVDTHRAAVVARHLDLLFRLLHHHHELEDELIVPILRDRVEDRFMAVIDVMSDQHAEVDRLDAEATGLLAGFAATAECGRLADLLDEIHLRLVEHLDLEEQVVLPLAERHLRETEWVEIGRRADASIPREERALGFGMLQYEGDPDVLASMLAPAPRLVRLLVPRLASRAYRRHAIAVHGTPTP